MKHLWIIGSAFLALILLAGILLPMFALPSNCGGNSAALAACKTYSLVVRIWSNDHDGQNFSYEQAAPETKRELARLPEASFFRHLQPARLLAKIEDVQISPAFDKRVVMVCDKAYDNVPQQRFSAAPLAHAVAYSNGEVGLISPDEFSRLDLSGFVDLMTLSEDSIEPSSPPNPRSASLHEDR